MRRGDRVEIIAGPKCGKQGTFVREGLREATWVVLDGEKQPRRFGKMSDYLRKIKGGAK